MNYRPSRLPEGPFAFSYGAATAGVLAAGPLVGITPVVSVIAAIGWLVFSGIAVARGNWAWPLASVPLVVAGGFAGWLFSI